SGAGNCFPSILVVALGEPGTPVTVCATHGIAARTNAAPHRAIGTGRALIRFSLRVSTTSRRLPPSPRGTRGVGALLVRADLSRSRARARADLRLQTSGFLTTM